MNKLDRYISRQVLVTTLVVIFVLASLDIIFGLMEELDRLRGNYQFMQALQYILMRSPRVIAEYLSLACLIGCLAGLGTLAASSELTVMRAAGISSWRISLSVLMPMMLISGTGLLVSEYVAPELTQRSQEERALAQGRSNVSANGGKGFWHREHNQYMNFGAIGADGRILNLAIYEFDEQMDLVGIRRAEQARYQEGHWLLQKPSQVTISAEQVTPVTDPSTYWDSELTPSGLRMVTTKPRDMSMSDLYTYGEYLERQGLNADKYFMAFWNKIMQPISTFALMVLGISFIFGPLRQVSPSYRIFMGVLVGLTYKYAEGLLAPVSLVFGFAPILATLIPIVICFALGAIMLRRAG